jgi:formylmethanofuran--tetrahydromethanopterin N-formyltransferase
LYCPSIHSAVTDTAIPADVTSVYEIVINGLNLEAVQTAIARGVEAAAAVPGVQELTAANYGGKLGPYKAVLKEILNLEESNN